MPKVQALGSNGSGRLGRSRRVSTSLAEINVVPLVDVMLVLLIIFMVTAPMMQRGVDVKLPTAARANPITGERPFISIPAAYRQNHLVYLDNEPIRVEILQERVRQRMEHATDKNVYLRGDGGVQLQELMDIVSMLKAAGVENVGIVAKLPGER